MFNRSVLGFRLRWDVKLFGNAKPPDHELVDFQSSDSGATYCQFTDGNSTDGQRADGDCTQCQSAKYLRCDAR